MGLPQVTMFQYYQWIGLRQKLPEPPHVSWENRWFPVDVPLSQSIEMLNHSGYLFILPSHWQHDAIPYIRLIPHFPTNMKISQLMGNRNV